MQRILLWSAIAMLLFSSGCRAGADHSGPVRPAAVAGKFYPAERDKLDQALSYFLVDAVAPRTAKPVAIVVPHAGIVYSGQIAADAFRQAAAFHYDVVVIIGTNHTTAGFSGVSIYARGAFETPLGTVAVDEDLAQKLLSADKDFVFAPEVHQREHSVEVEVLFVQHLFPKAKIVPAVIGQPDADLCARFGQALAAVLNGKDALIVASSDLSHYPAYEDAQKVDHQTLAAIATMQPENLQATVRRQMRQGVPNLQTCACGEGPIMAAMTAARGLGAPHATVISSANSGDAAVGEYDQVVGYGAVVFSAGVEVPDTSTLTANVTDTMQTTYTPIPAAERKALLALARKSIEWYLKAGVTPLSRHVGAAEMRRQGAFVTLKKRGDLRGCVGHMSEDMPLARTVTGMALMAAFEDERFRPVTQDEMKDIEIEISALTPFQRVPDASSIKIGRDGVVLRKGGRSAVFLPQVAPEQGWTRDEMLDHLCQKAGLPEGAWKQGAEFSTFQAEVFSESDIK
jgi:MEMO1 family protein